MNSPKNLNLRIYKVELSKIKFAPILVFGARLSNFSIYAVYRHSFTSKFQETRSYARITSMRNRVRSIVVLFMLWGVVVPYSVYACAWFCGAGGWDYTDEICTDAFVGGGENFTFAEVNDGRLWNGLRLGIGWTGWWHRMVNHCVTRDLWTDVRVSGRPWGDDARTADNSLFVPWTWANLSFRIGGGPPEELTALRIDECNRGQFCIKGRTQGPRITTSQFNSPFIYFDDAPDGVYSVSLSSAADKYRSDPEFNQDKGWNVRVEEGSIHYDNALYDHLFYELDVPSVTLNRNGRNFETKESLYEFLESSDFFDQLGMYHHQAQNSLDYVKNNLADGEFYYLTVLSQEAVDAISQVDISTKGKSLVVGRKYFALYPSPVKVKSTGELIYPDLGPVEVEEYGEILIKNNMEVFWDN